jgi:hypothetical protein
MLHDESRMRLIQPRCVHRQYARYDEEGMKIMDKMGHIHFQEDSMGPPEEARPEIDRWVH